MPLTRDEDIADLLNNARTIAMVGASDRPNRPSHGVMRALQDHGYRVIPVNPGHRQILGERCYRSLSEIPSGERVDVVDVFRRSEYVAAVAEEAIARGVGFFWMQYGITDPEAARKLEEAGIPVAMDRCILVEHGRLGIPARRRNAVDGKNVAFPGRPVGGRGI